MSFREKLKKGVVQQKSTVPHKFKGNYTLNDDGWCDHEQVKEGNYFLIKTGRMTNGYNTNKR